MSPPWRGSRTISGPGRCVLVGDAGFYSAGNLGELAKGLGRYILAVPIRRLKEVEGEVLARPGRYRKIAANLEVKEVWVGRGERRRRYIVCFNPEEAQRQRLHRAAVLEALQAELGLLAERDADHPKAACQLMASRRFARYLSADAAGRPQLDPAKVKAAERLDGMYGRVPPRKSFLRRFNTFGQLLPCIRPSSATGWPLASMRSAIGA
jgi:hypothetical protein